MTLGNLSSRTKSSMQPTDSIEKLPGVGEANAAKLHKLGVFCIEDLIKHFPWRYDDFSKITKISETKVGGSFTVRAAVKSLNSRPGFRFRKGLAEALVSDDSGSLAIVWFNQPYLAQTLKAGATYLFSGQISFYKSLQMQNPVWELAKAETVHTGRIVPVYPLTAGMTPKWLRTLLKKLLNDLPVFTEIIPPDIVKRRKLMPYDRALRAIHFPPNLGELEQARKRLAFNELLIHEIGVLSRRKKLKSHRARPIPFEQKLVQTFVNALPFHLTKSQKLAAWEILRDMEKPCPANRLVAGDVGSGKTVVAAIAALQTADRGYNTAFMAPTEILASQHFQTFSAFPEFQKHPLALLTANSAKFFENGEELTLKKSGLHELLKNRGGWVVFGTHALIQKNVNLKNLGLVVVDEQHRFGVQQRLALARGLTQTKKQTNADDELLYEDLTYKLRNCVFEVKKDIGLGHKEIIYQKALALKMKEESIAFEREKPIPIIYKGEKIGVYQPDFIVEDKIILELKALPFTGNIEKKQAWTYLKGSNYKLALLINFASDDVQIKRIIYDSARQRESASVPRESALMPHFLSLTATPIPRTLALTLYGDLDVSAIKEMPAGRKNVETSVILPQHRKKVYAEISREIALGRQVFFICPLIDPSDKLGVKSATEMHEFLQTSVFPENRVGLLHGRLRPGEKEAVIKAFGERRLQILVSTTVVEVGVDFPNATIMAVEGAERFGLAQLHQLRGRVGRSSLQSYCYLLPQNLSAKAEERLQALCEHHNGLELAEIDLKLRGPGEAYGNMQSGYPEFQIASIYDLELLTAAREEAEILLSGDKLQTSPRLLELLNNAQQKIHLE